MNMADHTEDNDPFEEDIVFDEAGLLGGKMPRSRQQSTAGFLPTFMLFIRTVCLCIAFLGLGLCVSVSGGPLMRLEMDIGIAVNLALQTFTARSVGMLIGAFLGSVLFEVYNRQFLMFVSLVWVAVSITMLPFTVHPALWWTFVTTVALGMGLGFLFTGGNVLCLDLWGRQGGASLQALHFSFAVGAFIVPLVMQPFFVGMRTHTNPSSLQVYTNGSFSTLTHTHTLASTPVSTPATQMLLRRRRDINFSNNNDNNIVILHSISNDLHNNNNNNINLDLISNDNTNNNILDSVLEGQRKQKLLRFERDVETRKADVKRNTTKIFDSFSEEEIKQLTLPKADKQAQKQTNVDEQDDELKNTEVNTDEQADKPTDKQSNTDEQAGKREETDGKQATTDKQTNVDVKQGDKETNTSAQETKQTNTDAQAHDPSGQTNPPNEKPSTESQTDNKTTTTTTIDYSENVNLPQNLSTTAKPGRKKPTFTNGNHLERDDTNSWKKQPDNDNINDNSNPGSNPDGSSSQVGEIDSKQLLLNTPTTHIDSDQQTTTTTTTIPTYTHTQQGLTTVPTLPTHTHTTLQTHTDEQEETSTISSVQETTTAPTTATTTTTTPTTTTTTPTTTTTTPTTTTTTTTTATTTTVSTTVSTNSGTGNTFPVDMAEPESMYIPQPEVQNVRENPIQDMIQLGTDDDRGGNVMNPIGNDDSGNVNDVKSTPSYIRHSSKPGTFSIGTDENSKVLDNVAQKLKDYGVTKVHLAYICIGIFIILNALISVVILCHNPRETRSKQDDGINKMQKGRIIVFTAIFSVFMFMSEALQGAVHHLLASAETDSGLDIIRESKIDGQALFWGLVCLVRFLCILASGCLRVKPGKLLTASVLFALIGSVFMAIGSFGKEDFLWGGIVFQALGLAPILPTSLLWMAQYMRVTHRMCALMIVLASFGNSLSHSLLTRVASQSEVYAFILVLLSFVCLFFLLVSVCVMYSAQRSKSLGVPVGYQLANQHEEEDSIELTPSGSAVFTPQDTRVRENGEAGQSLLID